MKVAEDRIGAFETRYSSALTLGNAEANQAKGEGTDFRTMLIQEINNTITESVRQCKSNLEQRYNELYQNYIGELLRIKGQMEMLRQWIRDKRGLVTN